MSVRVTILVENTARGMNMLGEHGLSYWVDMGTRRILFDTGQGMCLQNNAEQLDIDLQQADAIVLSHGHLDHSGGLDVALRHTPSQAPVYMHPDALQKKWGYSAKKTKPCGMPEKARQALAYGGREVRYTTDVTELGDGLFVTGMVPRRTAYEDTGGAFYLDKDKEQIDPINDDQSLFFDTSEGVVVVLGCAHAGVVNTLYHVQEVMGKKTIRACIGGMHLLNATDERLEQTIEAFREIGVQQLSPCHCAGARQCATLWQRFPSVYEPCAVGTVFEFE